MKRALSAILSSCLVFSCIAVSTAASFPDTASHWASATIEYMAGKKILNGYDDGNFHPNGYPDANGSVEVNGKRYRGVTRAEFIKMLDETFGLTATTNISYTDVSSSDWFYGYVAKAAAQGYLLNYGTQLNPNGELSRQEAAALLVRYLDLDPDVKAQPSMYPDYASIKTAYRDYVLMATAEGLFKGYEEDGTFRPDRILSRAEALTILSRAAGTIFSESASGADPAAAPNNGVITKSGVTVQNATLNGRLIVGEGAGNGTVTLSGCTIGELILRGTASVILSDCTVDSLIVDASLTGYTASIALTNQSKITAAELRTPADISLSSRTSIATLTVEEDAKRSAVSGSGSLQTANVHASGFIADMMPQKYTLGDGIVATFNGKSYSGSSTDASQSGFSTAPSTYASATNCYLTGTTTVSGTLYYYFTNSSAVPTRDTFQNYYNVATLRSSHTVTANLPRDTSIGATASVSEYPYIAVMLMDTAGNKYQPVVVTNKASSGFTVNPSVTVSGSYQYLAFTPAESGTVYYYYTNYSSVPPTLSAFTTNYNASSTYYKGTLSATAGQAVTNPTQKAQDVASYGYIAVVLADASGAQYQPVLVPVSASAQMTTTGFKQTPVIALSGDQISLTMTSELKGKVEFYFSASSTVPSASDFDRYYALAGTDNCGTRNLEKDRSYTALLGAKTIATTYPYVVLRFSSSTAKYQPLVLSMAQHSAPVDLTGSGFTSVPTLSVQNGYYYLTLPTSGQMAVYYYLTDSDSVSNSTVFMNNYNASVNSYLQTKTGGVLQSGYYTTPVQTIIPSSMYGTYKNMALMVVGGGYNSGYGSIYGSTTTTTQYQPIVIPLVAGSGTGTGTDTTTGHGFITGPSYTIYRADAHQAEFMTAQSGRVFYYYTDSTTETDGQTLVGRILMGDLSASSLAGYTDVTGYQGATLTLDEGSTHAYLMMVFMDGNGTIYQPVFVETNGNSSSASLTTGFNGNPTLTIQSGTPVLNYYATESGTLYYYFTNTSTAPSNANAFFTAYHSGITAPKGSASLTIGRGTSNLTTSYSAIGYSYVAMIYQSSIGGTGGYYKPFIIPTNGMSSGGTGTGTGTGTGGLASGNAFSGTPYLGSNILGGTTLYYTPLMTGTLCYAYTNTNNASTWLQDSLTPIVGALGGAGGLTGTSVSYQTLSSIIAQYGGGAVQNVTTYGTQQMAQIGTLNTSYSYMVVWMATGSTMSAPVFIPTTGTGSGSGGTQGGIGMYSNGFSSAPTSAYGGITFTPSYSGTVRYALTNQTASNMTSSDFEALYSIGSSMGYAGTIDVTAGVGGYLPVSGTPSGSSLTFKYCYVMLTSGSTNFVPALVTLP